MSQSIWKESNKGGWKLLFNTNIKPLPESEEPQTKKSAHKTFLDTQIYTLGTLFVGPKGIGRLLQIKDTNATLLLSQTNTEENFEVKEISNKLNIFIKRYDNNFINWYRVTLPVNGNIELLKEEIEKMKLFDLTSCNYTLIANGTELKEEYSFDQLDFKHNNKLLFVKEKITSFTIKRYKTLYEWWYGYNSDGISFTCSKKIRLTGVGLYCSHENKAQNGDLILCEESDPTFNLGEVLEIEVPPAGSKEDSVFPVMFIKPVILKPNIVYMIEFKCRNPCSMYYGAQGQESHFGEKNVEFTFKMSSQEFGHGTNVQSGNFPEFYYYA